MRHEFDPWSFVPGLVLGAFGLVVLVGGVDVTGWNFSWVGPAVLIVGGLALLLGSRRRRDALEPATAAPPPPPSEEEPSD
jgi:membrane protein implicated in regulation of membrane protease activity